MAITSETFSGSSVPASFTESDPQADVTNTVGSGVLTISVPSGTGHDWYRTDQNRMLLWQSHDDSDFDVTLKFDADIAFTGTFKVIGIGVTDSSENAYVRATIYSNSSARRAFFYGYNGSEGEVTEADINVSFQTVRYLRLIYDSSAGEFEMQYSADATTWTSVGTMTYTMSADRVGIAAGNAGSNPAFSIDIDEWTDNNAASDDHTIAVDDISVGSSIDGATITQDHSINPTDIEVGASVDNTSLSLSAEISPNDLRDRREHRWCYDHPEPCV